MLLDGCDDGDGGDDPDADYEDDDNDDECDYEDDDGISLKGGRNGSTNLWMLIKRSDGWMRRFRRNGACVDLSSDPFGWEEGGGHSEGDDVDDNTGRDDDDDDARCSNSLFLHGCTMNKLSLVAMAIRRAAAAIEARRGTTAGGRNPSGGATMRPRRRRAVPVVFDTLAPLLHAHGAVRVVRFLKSLRIVLHPPSSSSSSSSSVLSPVVVSVLHESLRPSEQRSLEDVSDALAHLRLLGGAPSSGGGGVGGRGPSSASASAANNDVDGSAVVVVSGMLDLVRRGGGGGPGGGMRGGQARTPLRTLPRHEVAVDDDWLWRR